MEFLLITDSVKGTEQDYNQTQEEDCFEECLYRRIAHHATLVQRGADLRENVST